MSKTTERIGKQFKQVIKLFKQFGKPIEQMNKLLKQFTKSSQTASIMCFIMERAMLFSAY